MSGYAPSSHPHQYQNQSGKQGVCVQIGLHDVAEFLYLAKPNWRENLADQESLKQIPASVAGRFRSWRYYGVDSDVGSIVKMIEKYGNGANTHWVQAAVGMIPAQLLKLRSYFAGGHFIGFGCSLQRLFSLLNLRHVDVLVMDVEGSEIRIFETYNWVIKPAFISIEVHGNHRNTSSTNPAMLNQHIHVLDSILTRQGYKQMKKEYTNLNTTGYATCELQYLL